MIRAIWVAGPTWIHGENRHGKQTLLSRSRNISLGIFHLAAARKPEYHPRAALSPARGCAPAVCWCIIAEHLWFAPHCRAGMVRACVLPETDRQLPSQRSTISGKNLSFSRFPHQEGWAVPRGWQIRSLVAYRFGLGGFACLVQVVVAHILIAL